MTALFDDTFAFQLATEFAGKIITFQDLAFDDYDFAMFIANHTDGAKVIWTEDGVGVTDENVLLKTVMQYNRCPCEVKHVQLTLNMGCSFSQSACGGDENAIGAMVLGIWNARLEKELGMFSDLRTIVLIRNKTLTDFAVLEFETKPFDPAEYTWEWNQNGNLEGYVKGTDTHRFSWQPHGSQFTHIPPIPSKRLKIHLKKPPCVNHDVVLKEIAFDPSWIEIVE